MKTQSAAFFLLSSLVVVAGPRVDLSSSNMPDDPPAQTIASVNAFPGLWFSAPLAIVSAPGERRRVFVVEKTGRIQMVNLGGSPQVSTFLNIHQVLQPRGEALLTGSEQGLLGLAFHPDYASNGRFFVVYNVWTGGAAFQRLSEFRVSQDPDVADGGTERVFIEQRNEAGNHNGGDIHFGPDGYLYMSWGDEGGSNDALDNSQRIDKDFWSSVTRIDVDLEGEDYGPMDGLGNDDDSLLPNDHPAVVRDAAGRPRYEVPADNPWVGASEFLGRPVSQGAVRTEFYAVGLRNPWRFSFDRATGVLWLGDVGQGAREEINRVVKGGNYEWAFREGLVKGVKWDERPNGWVGSHPPVIDYGRSQGVSVTGGVVYRGSGIPSLTGKYVFGDYGSGSIWVLEEVAGVMSMRRIAGQAGVAAFGHDPSNGDLLMANLNGGTINRLVGQNVENDFPQTLAATGLFTDVATLTPAAGLVAYDVNLPFWSDGADKQRWFGIPNSEDKVLFSEEGNWGLPSGMTWVKHFEMEVVEGGQVRTRRLETRVMVRTDEGNYGVSYRWNEAGTEATLAASKGEGFQIMTMQDGMVKPQQWEIPSRSQCMTCHTAQAGHALSFRTRQLNLEGEISGDTGNFIQLLANSGYLEGLDTSVNHLPRHYRPNDLSVDRERRVRAYLDVNCAYCHHAESAIPADWDARASLKLFATGMVNGAVRNGKQNPADELLVPGDHQRSVIYNRLAVENGYTRMPPLGSSVEDKEGVALLRNWIDQSLVDRESYADWRLRYFGSGSQGGEPTGDDDFDGRTNRAEFLAGTDPGVLDVGPAPAVERTVAGIELSMQSLEFRDVFYEVSDDLVEWELLNVVGNHGADTVSAGVSDDRRFFRARIEER